MFFSLLLDHDFALKINGLRVHSPPKMLLLSTKNAVDKPSFSTKFAVLYTRYYVGVIWVNRYLGETT